MAQKAGNPIPKVKLLLDAMAIEDWPRALSIANRFPELGQQKVAIQRAHNARLRPAFYADLGYDVEATVQSGIAALKERYGSR
jgi:hypothetical protein